MSGLKSAQKLFQFALLEGINMMDFRNSTRLSIRRQHLQDHIFCREHNIYYAKNLRNSKSFIVSLQGIH